MRAYAPSKHALVPAMARPTHREPQPFHESIYVPTSLLSHPTPLNPAAPRANARRTPRLPPSQRMDCYPNDSAGCCPIQAGVLRRVAATGCTSEKSVPREWPLAVGGCAGLLHEAHGRHNLSHSDGCKVSHSGGGGNKVSHTGKSGNKVSPPEPRRRWWGRWPRRQNRRLPLHRPGTVKAVIVTMAASGGQRSVSRPLSTSRARRPVVVAQSASTFLQARTMTKIEAAVSACRGGAGAGGGRGGRNGLFIDRSLRPAVDGGCGIKVASRTLTLVQPAARCTVTDTRLSIGTTGALSSTSACAADAASRPYRMTAATRSPYAWHQSVTFDARRLQQPRRRRGAGEEYTRRLSALGLDAGSNRAFAVPWHLHSMQCPRAK